MRPCLHFGPNSRAGRIHFRRWYPTNIVTIVTTVTDATIYHSDDRFDGTTRFGCRGTD
jgi:hypothetical protein